MLIEGDNNHSTIYEIIRKQGIKQKLNTKQNAVYNTDHESIRPPEEEASLSQYSMAANTKAIRKGRKNYKLANQTEKETKTHTE